jgi:hypothetical protein
VKYLILFLLLLTGCSTTVFGGKVVSPYVKHFQGQVECARVQGWYLNTACVCWLVNRDVDDDIVFIHMKDEVCGRVVQR